MEKNVFEEAAKAYVAVMNTATEMFKFHQQSMANDGKNFDVRVGLNQLDVIIQYSMLQVALNDCNLDENEVNFIKSMSQFCDFCDYLNQAGYQGVTWDVIFNTDENSLKEVLEESKESVISLSEDFVKVFSLIDAMTEHNYLDDLYKNFCAIISGVMNADGKTYKEEVTNGCLLVDLLNAVDAKKKDFENIIASKNAQPKEQPNAKKSLKDYYVKKN